MMGLAACGAAQQPPSPPAHSRLSEPELTGALRWSPPLIDALGDDPATPERDLVNVVPVTLEWCAASGSCRVITTIDPPSVVRSEAASANGRFAVVEHGRPGQPGGLAFLDARRGVEVAWVPLDSGPSGAPAELLWTAGANLLRTWSGGSDDSLGTLYDSRGGRLSSYDAPVLSISPDARFLVEYTPTWAPKALSRSFTVHDLATGTELTSLRVDLAGVTGVGWLADRVVITYQSLSGQTRTAEYSTR